MWNCSKLQELDTEIRELKKSDHKVDVTGILQAALRDAEDPDVKLYILSRLASECQLLHRLEEAEDAIKQQIDLDPNKPEAWLQLAVHYYRHVRDLPKALLTVEVAIEKATHEGNFVRQAHGERIRIALATKDYELVENSLATLIDYTPLPGSLDVELESDFVPRIPVSSVRHDLVEKYRKLAQPR